MFTLSNYSFYKTDDDVIRRAKPEDDALSNYQKRRLNSYFVISSYMQNKNKKVIL